MNNSARFTKTLLSTLVATCVATGAYAQSGDVEEVIVTGVRGAQERAITVKRNSAEVVDSISAEDIGKLPDATIADSLQRVTGVQISRSAGQGGVVSIRGTGEILTTMNGEVFLTAENILDSKANYQDVPSSLFSGSNVYKSMSAKQIEGGIGGSIDLLTRKSLTLSDGFSAAVRAQASEGSITKTTDPDVNGFVGFNWNDTTAMSLAMSYSDQTLSDNAIDTKAANNVQDEGSWNGAANRDVNGDGDQSDRFLIMSNWDGPRLYKNNTERERLGLAYNFNSKVGDAFEVNFDSFYNTMDQHAAGNYIHLGDETAGYDRSNITELYGITPVGQKDMFAQFYTTGRTIMSDGAIRGGVQSDYRNTSAHNNSLELKYDAGGAFTGSVRYVDSKAHRSTDNLTIAQMASSPGGADGLAYNVAGDKRVVNPGFISTRYPVTFQSYDDSVSVAFDPTLAAALQSPTAWYIHSSWIEGETQEVGLNVLRADGNFKIAEEGITSIDFGIRKAERSAERNQFSWFMPTNLTAYDTANGNKEYANMLVKYHEAGYTPGKVNEGAFANYRVQVGPEKNPLTDPKITWEPVRGVNIDESHVAPYLHTVTDFGAGVSSFNAAIPMIDTNKIGGHVGFMDMLYDAKHVAINRPQYSYQVVDTTDAFFVNANFNSDLSDSVNLSGTAGVRRITQTIEVVRNVTDGTRDPRIIAGADHNHSALIDLGDKTDFVDNSYFLPSMNLNFSFYDTYKIKLSYDERLSQQPLNNYGEGSVTSYQSQRLEDGKFYQPIGDTNLGGNPNLSPWSTNVYNLGFEMYPNESTLLGLTFFYMDVGGFSDTKSTFVATAPDSDGKVRNGGNTIELIDGKNATIEGAEFSYQQSFDFLPGILSNTGMTWNYTYSPSKKEGQRFQFDNGEVPFNNTAKNQSNLVLWYNDEMFEFRLAANYLSKKYDGQYTNWTLDPLQGDSDEGLVGGLDRWEDSTLYIDLGATYHITDSIDANLNVQNITEESNRKYLRWENFRSEYYNFERRITLGVSAKF